MLSGEEGLYSRRGTEGELVMVVRDGILYCLGLGKGRDVGNSKWLFFFFLVYFALKKE